MGWKDIMYVFGIYYVSYFPTFPTPHYRYRSLASPPGLPYCTSLKSVALAHCDASYATTAWVVRSIRFL